MGNHYSAPLGTWKDRTKTFSALKGQNKITQGVALGMRGHVEISPVGAKQAKQNFRNKQKRSEEH